MTSTTSPTPEPDESAESGAVRSARLIHNEATTEIPVHLLFRDETEPVPLAPAVVERQPDLTVPCGRR